MTTIQLDLTTRKLNLLLEFDRIRDQIDYHGNPQVMFEHLLTILANHFKADSCAILVIDDETQDSQLIVNLGMSQGTAINLCQTALEFSEPTIIESDIWAQIIGLRILIDNTSQIAGSLCLARKQNIFDDDDYALMVLAESQIDSAVMQARNLWSLQERNRQLEIIYKIDRIRDNAEHEDELLNSLTGLIIEYFESDLCIIATSDDVEESIIRSIIDRLQLSTSAIQDIIEQSNQADIIKTLVAPPEAGRCQILSGPFIIAGKRIGSIIIGRRSGYQKKHKALLESAISQADSAIDKLRTARQLELRKRELEAIYRIDRIRDQESEFDLMMQQVLHELCSAVTSETGFIMLYQSDNEEVLELKASTRDAVLTEPEYFEAVRKISRQALAKENVVSAKNVNHYIRSIMATPLILNERIIGVFGAINHQSQRGFSDDDLRIMSAITSQVDTAVFERLERRRMRQVLSRSVDPKVLEALLQQADDRLLVGEHLEITVLFADIRGSTEWAEVTQPEEFVLILNTFLSIMTDVIFKHGGTLDKFVGDEIIAIFGAPVHETDHAIKAARAGMEMQRIHAALQSEFKEQGRYLPPMGIGISTGIATVGEFGPPIRTDYTAMGRIMNLGSRLCSLATGGQVIISENTFEYIKDQSEASIIESVQLKGINQSIKVYQLDKIAE